MQQPYPCPHLPETALWKPLYLVRQGLDEEPIRNFVQKLRPETKEILHQDSGFFAGKSEKGTAESSKPHDTHTAQLQSPPKHQKPFFVVPDKAKESNDEISTVPK